MDLKDVLIAGMGSDLPNAKAIEEFMKKHDIRRDE